MDENKKRILVKIADLEKNLADIPKIAPNSVEEYILNRKDQLALERLLQICIENIIDICALLIKRFNLGVPTNEENILDLLSSKLKNIDKIKEMKRFRNVIVHKYAEINNKLVYRNAVEKVEDFTNFIENVRELIR